MASAQEVAMRKYTPIAYEEMKGIASVDPELPLQHLMRLTIFPELEAFDHFHPYRCDLCDQVIESEQWTQCVPCDQDFCLTCSGVMCPSGLHPRSESSETGEDLPRKLNQIFPPGKKCSSFARAEPGSYLCGQTDEEKLLNPKSNTDLG